MEYTVITYGAGEVLTTTFNAIAALINAESGSLYKPLVRFALMIGLAWAVAAMVYGDRAKFLTNWAVPFYLALNLFFAPTCKVFVHDNVTGYKQKVDNVPWGLGAVAGMISQIGDVTTREIEKTFSLPDDLKYHKTGSVMASNLIANSRQFRITNLELRETMKSFVNQCVVYDALIGNKYTFNDLQNAKDIWALIKSNASPARSFVFKAPGKESEPKIMTCAQGVRALEPYLTRDVENAFQLFESKIFGEKCKTNTFSAGAQLKQYLPGAFDYMTAMSKSAQEYMLQQMMIHTVVDSIESKSSELGNAPNFAVRRAYLQQRANQETVVGIAAQKMIAIKNVMEALIYAAFIFILPMALLPLGWRFISRWVGLMMWVQLWPPLYAVLNLIMNMAARSKGIGAITDPSGTGITIANSVGFMDLHADMAAQAGFMTIAVGSLAYALVRGGAASFVHLASHLAGPAMSAAASATESMMSGNYSFGNISQGTVSAFNTTFGQQNLSPSYSSGAFTQNDGLISRSTSADGSHVVSIANSNLRSSVNLSDSITSNYSEQANKSTQMAHNQMVSSSWALSDHNRQTMEFASHQSKMISGGESFGLSDSGSQNKSVALANNLTDRFAKENSLSKEDAQQILGKATASLSTGVGFEFLGNGASARLTGEVSGQLSHINIDRNTWNAAKDFSKQHNLQDVLSSASQAIRDSKYSEMSDQGKRLTDGISSSYEQSNQFREESNKSLQKSESYSELASWSKQHAHSINANLNQEYVDWLQGQSLPNSSGRMGIGEAETILQSRPDLNQQYQQRFVEEKSDHIASIIENNKLPSSSSNVQSSYNSMAMDNNVSSASIDEVSSKASSDGFGDAFSVSNTSQNAVKEKLGYISDQIAEQNERIEKEAKIREQGLKS